MLMSIETKLRKSPKKQGGFTLAELAVVVIVIGIIAAIIIPRFTGAGAAKSRATAIRSFADSSATIIASAVSQLNLAFSDEGSTNANIMIPGGPDWLDVVVRGNNPTGLVKAAYQQAYILTGAGTLEGSVQVGTAPTAAAKGTYELQGHPIDVAGGLAAAAAIPATPTARVGTGPGQFATGVVAGTATAGCGLSTGLKYYYFIIGGVTEDEFQALYSLVVNPDAAGPATGVFTGPLRFSAVAADGTRYVCIEKQVA